MVIRRLFYLVILFVLFVGVIPAASAAPQPQSRVVLTLGFIDLPQGQAGMVRLNGSDIAEARAIFQERVFFFYPQDTAYFTVLSADVDLDPGTYPLAVWVRHTDDSTEQIDQPVEVSNGGYAAVDLTLPASLSPLLAEDVNQAEMDKLFNIMDRFTPERYWGSSGFVIPNNGEQIAWFGTWRLYNESYWYRHTGVDIRVGTGTPFPVAANGRVILAESMPIRGNYVLVDHGWGIYSGYAHLSQIQVVPGQWVKQGDVLGLSGSTGRSGGAHMHFEMAVGGVWIDPLPFLTLPLVSQ